jgi:ribosomal protein L40E
MYFTGVKLMSKSKNTKMLIVALICISLLLTITGYRLLGGKGDFDPHQKIWMICDSGQCGEQFQITAQEYSDFVTKNENPMGMPSSKGYTCPKCGISSGFAAEQCVKCEHLFLRGASGPAAFPDKCPQCGYSKLATGR